MNLNQMKPVDLKETWRLMELYQQAIDKKLATDNEAGRLSFIALAERARAKGNNPQKLFAWLLKKQKFEYITQADEDAASVRIRALKNGKRKTEAQENDERGASGGGGQNPKQEAFTPTEDEKFMIACIKIADQRNLDPIQIAHQLKSWTKDHWQTTKWDYDQKRRLQWQNPEDQD